MTEKKTELTSAVVGSIFGVPRQRIVKRPRKKIWISTPRYRILLAIGRKSTTSSKEA